MICSCSRELLSTASKSSVMRLYSLLLLASAFRGGRKLSALEVLGISTFVEAHAPTVIKEKGVQVYARQFVYMPDKQAGNHITTKMNALQIAWIARRSVNHVHMLTGIVIRC